LTDAILTITPRAALLHQLLHQRDALGRIAYIERRKFGLQPLAAQMLLRLHSQLGVDLGQHHVAPLRPKRRPNARPTPRPPPVITTVCPANSNSLTSGLLRKTDRVLIAPRHPATVHSQIFARHIPCGQRAARLGLRYI